MTTRLKWREPPANSIDFEVGALKVARFGRDAVGRHIGWACVRRDADGDYFGDAAIFHGSGQRTRPCPSLDAAQAAAEAIVVKLLIGRIVEARDALAKLGVSPPP